MSKENNSKIEWRTEKRRINDLLPNTKNPRILSDAQADALKKSLEKFNLAEIPVINTDNSILAGHQRIKMLQMLGRGEEIIDVRIPSRSLTKKEADQYLLTSNAVHGSWDFELLAQNFNTDLLLEIGFEEMDLSNIWDANLETEDDGFDVEKEIKKIKKPVSRLGDMFQLGSHRIICGSAEDPKVLKRLFDKDCASMIYSDPVYNIGVDYSAGIGGKQNYGGNVNDHRTDAEYKAFLEKSMESALLVAKDDTHVFYWGDESYIWLLQELYRELGIANKRVCLWIKNGHNPTPGVGFNKCYEACVYGVRGKPYLTKGIDNLNEVMNKEIGTGNRMIDDILDMLNIWMVKRLAGTDYTHATSKPPTLHEKAIRRCTRPGDIILDSFLGSASTLIAADQLKRRCYGVELEPLFIDLAILRYEKLTGTKAKKIS